MHTQNAGNSLSEGKSKIVVGEVECAQIKCYEEKRVCEKYSVYRMKNMHFESWRIEKDL